MNKIVLSVISCAIFSACGSAQQPLQLEKAASVSVSSEGAPVPAPAKSVCLPGTCAPEPKATVSKPAEPEKVVQKCPNDMTFINGTFCDKIEEHCLNWMDDTSKSYARCKKYAKSTCVGNKVHMNYCIDTEEMHDETGLPYGDKSWNDCKALCEGQSKRLCNQPEWAFACMGEELHPYPYGTGYDFDTVSCDIERQPLLDSHGKIYDHRARITEFPKCVSDWKIHNMIGSIDEWIEVPRYNHSKIPGFTMRSALVGGHAKGGRHRCSVRTTDHEESFKNPPTTGCRCCASNN